MSAIDIDRATIALKRSQAEDLRARAERLEREADQIERELLAQMPTRLADRRHRAFAHSFM